MTGLEKILEDIKKEADTESQKILKEAEAKASVIKQEAEKMNPPPSSAGHR